MNDTFRICWYRYDWRRCTMSSGKRPDELWKEAMFHRFTDSGRAIVELSDGTVDVISISADGGYKDSANQFSFVKPQYPTPDWKS